MRRIWASNVDSLPKRFEKVFSGEARRWKSVDITVGDGPNLNKKLWAKRKHLKASEKGSSPNKSDPFALKMPLFEFIEI